MKIVLFPSAVFVVVTPSTIVVAVTGASDTTELSSKTAINRRKLLSKVR